MKSGTFTNNTSFTATAAQVNVPTGTVLFKDGKFTVPNGITVLKIHYEGKDFEEDDTQYIGVTPGSTHKLYIDTMRGTNNNGGEYNVNVQCSDHRETWFDTSWYDSPYQAEPDAMVYISWSPEINKHSVDFTDY